MNKILDSIDPQVTAVAIINLNNLAYNYNTIKSTLTENSTAGAVVKANAYGFGAIPVSKKLYQEGCRHFFVATTEEGIELRPILNNDAKIYVLGGLYKNCESLYLQYDIIPVLNDIDQINAWINYSNKINKKLNAVVQIDTGMCRNGLSIQEAKERAQYINNNLNLLFILSHLACADNPNSTQNILQLSKFKDVLTAFGNNIKASLSATNGIFLGHEYQFDITRPGKALYGFSIRKDMIGNMKPVMNIFARILQISKKPIGSTIGYDATFTATKNMKLITVGFGYADGFMRKFSGFGNGFINNEKLPIVGRISMDYILLDGTNIPDEKLKTGNWIAFTNETDYTLEKWALEMKTLPHEVTCRFGRRVKRIYIDKNIYF